MKYIINLRKVTGTIGNNLIDTQSTESLEDVVSIARNLISKSRLIPSRAYHVQDMYFDFTNKDDGIDYYIEILEPKTLKVTDVLASLVESYKENVSK